MLDVYIHSHTLRLQNIDSNVHQISQGKKIISPINNVWIITNIYFSTYMKFPQYYTKYKDPPVLPLTLDRSYRAPYLPERALTGRYAPSSDSSYKR